MRTRQEVGRVMALRAGGLNACELGRRTGILRGTVRDWLAGRIPDFGSPDNPPGSCPVCRADPQPAAGGTYTYLLGLYLGDGCLSAHARGVYKLRISCANAYPELLHSDGCRVDNWVNGTPYPRYHCSNRSADIQAIFGRACGPLGIQWRPHSRVSLSVARRASVALLDGFVESTR